MQLLHEIRMGLCNLFTGALKMFTWILLVSNHDFVRKITINILYPLTNEKAKGISVNDSKTYITKHCKSIYFYKRLFKYVVKRLGWV